MTDDDALLLDEVARLIDAEATAVDFQKFLIKTLPGVLEKVVNAYRKQWDAELWGICNRLDRLERDLGEALAREQRRNREGR
jgi:hypothetical protein